MALFFSHGVTLEMWEKAGLLDRQVGYYRRLLQQVGDVTFVTYDRPSHLRDRLTDRVKPISVLYNRWGVHYRLFGLLAPLIHYKALRRCTYLRTEQISGAWTALIAKWITRRPLVVRCGYVLSRFVDRQGSSPLRRRVIRVVEGVVVRRADLVFVATPDDRRYILEAHHVTPNRVALVPNPIDTERFRPDASVRKQQGLVVFVGRLAPQKDLGLLVRAALRVPGASLVLAGSGPEEAALRSLAAGSDRIEFLGAVPNRELPALLNRAEVFALTSRYEGSPKALLEAMACGLAVVGTDVVGIDSVIRHGENGLLCQPDEARIAEALRSLLADQALRRRLGREARRFVTERHSEESVALIEAGLTQQFLQR